MNNLSLLRGSSIHLVDEIYIKHPTLKEIEELNGMYQVFLSLITDKSIDVADILLCEQDIFYEDIESEWNFFIEKAISNGKKISICIADDNDRIYSYQENCNSINEDYRDALNYFLGTEGTYVVLNKKNKDSKKQLYLQNVINYKDDKYMLKFNGFKFTEHFYEIINENLIKMNWIKKDYDFLKGGSKGAKKYILKHDYKQRKKNKKNVTITLDSIISGLIARGQNFQDIWNYPIYVVYDLYYRLLKLDEFEFTRSTLSAGNLDTKKNPIDWEKINWASVIK